MAEEAGVGVQFKLGMINIKTQDCVTVRFLHQKELF